MLLKLGMEGPDVANLEKVVTGLGFSGISMDGIFDQPLVNVIKYIQKSHGLVDDGKVGPATLALLDDLYEPDVHNFSLAGQVPPTPSAADSSSVTGLLSHVHPSLASKAVLMIATAKDEGYKIIVTQGLRTFAEQHQLFLQKPKVTNADAGQSYHNYGVAIDFAFIINGKPSWEDHLYKNIGRWASNLGLTWGGNWHFVDTPHVQLPNLPATGKMLAVYRMASGDINTKTQAVWNKFI